MIADTTVTNIGSIEELTIFSLDKSPDGIAALCEDMGICALEMQSGISRETLDRLSRLTEELHQLDVFEHSLCSLFNIDRCRISDEKGSLDTVMTDFRGKLHSLAAQLQDDSLQSEFAQLLETLPASLSRFNELISVLRAYIKENYLCEERESA